MLPMQTAPFSGEHSVPVLTDRAYDYITDHLARGHAPERIAAGLRAYFEIEITADQILPCWNTRRKSPTRTGPVDVEKGGQARAEGTRDFALLDADCAAPPERSADKASVQIPADEEKPPVLTAPDVPAPVDPPAPLIGADDDADGEEDRQTTQTGRRQDGDDSLQIPADTVDETTAYSRAIKTLASLAKARLGIASLETRNGPGPEARKAPSVLTDEVKTFIVRGLARYETPTRVAASVKTHFGIDIDRRQVFAYDPAGSRPPARRWIELHAATRAKFLRATAEIGIAQKVVRLRMLDRFANHADEANQTVRAAAFLLQAARECGGMYERVPRRLAA